MRILLVDDDPTIIEVFEMHIQHYYKDCFICSATNGIEALEMCRDNTFDLVLTDGKMPKMDGVELSKELKEINYSGVIILLTGYHEMNDGSNLEEFGIAKVLLKPVKLEDVRACIDLVRDKLSSNRQN
ncbi:response regulator transcription factor [Alteromonas flava]|uniref:response regulator transcription factor n=1 Tax=Alteromonas flava TaxID=2048003 RepID=UPI000C28AC3A|nr:response regulator [Alteromonas flava]